MKANNIIEFIKKEIVLIISLILALVTMVIVPPTRAYIDYIDFRTLAILFSLMVIMAGLQRLFVFRQIGELLISKVSTTRAISIVLILLCFVFSMFITNDVALLTFVPFTIVVLNMAKKNDCLIEIIVLETVAANLGSMMMPMGNPQNLYLYSLTSLSFLKFIVLMLPYGLLSLILILLLNHFIVKPEAVAASEVGDYTRSRREKTTLLIYICLFIISLLVVARIIDYRIGFIIVLATVLIIDRNILLKVDYSLLFTFIFLFIFIGNLKHIDAVSTGLSAIVGGHEIITAVVASQVISNVPAAILLSGFTDNIRGLIIGTNLGGLGTLIASMASLISFKQYGFVEAADKGRYIKVFTVINLGLLIILMAAALLI